MKYFSSEFCFFVFCLLRHWWWYYLTILNKLCNFFFYFCPFITFFFRLWNKLRDFFCFRLISIEKKVGQHINLSLHDFDVPFSLSFYSHLTFCFVKCFLASYIYIQTNTHTHLYDTGRGSLTLKISNKQKTKMDNTCNAFVFVYVCLSVHKCMNQGSIHNEFYIFVCQNMCVLGYSTIVNHIDTIQISFWLNWAVDHWMHTLIT